MKKITDISLILLLVMWLIPLNVHADNTAGDVNNDGEVNIADVNTVINFILGDRSRHGVDVNNDGEVNIADVNAIIGIILKGTSATEEHEYVDLMSTLTWASPAARSGQHVTSAPVCPRNTATISLGER